MELDFSKLEAISYRGFYGAEARTQKDKLIEQGYTIVEDAETPFTAVGEQSAINTTPPPASPLERKLEPFAGVDSSRNYRALYRAACNFHERHNPPLVEAEYWKNHTPGIDDIPQAELDYWEDVAEDMSATASDLHQDPFLMGLLMAIFEELEREYRAKKESCLS